MADRYWVGGSGTWDATAGTKWSTSSGGSGGASVPTSADNVFFTFSSGSGTVTVSGTRDCNNLTCTGFTGTLTGTVTPIIQFYGNVVIPAAITLSTVKFIKSGASSATFSSGGKTIPSFEVNGSGGVLTLSDALTVSSSGLITVTAGTFTTNNYSVSAPSITSSNSNTRAINLGSSTVSLNGVTPINFATSANLTFGAGTSIISCSNADAVINAGGLALYDVAYTANAGGSRELNNISSARNITIAGKSAAGVNNLSFSSDVAITGTLTLSTGSNATCRTFVRSNTIGTTRTLTCAAVASLQDIDFRDVTIAGAAAPVSGTRLGDCQGNSGIVFDASKTVYWNLAGSNNWSATGWATSAGGTPAVNNFPLAQDTAIFTSTSPGTGTTTTLNSAYNIGTLDMSARTTNTMTLATGTTAPQIYGNWINGTGITLSGTGQITFAGRGSQTITSAGKTFTQGITVNSPSGSVTLLDAFRTNRSNAGALTVTSGTFDAAGYNVTLIAGGSSVETSASTARTVAIGSGTWTLGGAGTTWNALSATNLTVTGTGIISLTGTSPKTFAGGGVQTYPTIRQAGSAALTISGSNKFANITNTVNSTVLFTGGTTNEFDAFTFSGSSTASRATLGSTNTTQAILKKPTAWNVGTESVDNGNNTGLSFTAGTIDFLNISYINGQVVAPTITYSGNFFLMF